MDGFGRWGYLSRLIGCRHLALDVIGYRYQRTITGMYYDALHVCLKLLVSLVSSVFEKSVTSALFVVIRANIVGNRTVVLPCFACLLIRTM